MTPFVVRSRSSLRRGSPIVLGILLGLVTGALPAGPAQSALTTTAAEYGLVVKLASGACSIDALATKYKFTVDGQIMWSRGVFRGLPVDPRLRRSPAEVKKVTDKMRGDVCVGYAEPDAQIALSGEQFHSWLPGPPQPATAEDWQDQSARTMLQLDAVHRTATGQGIIVAVLDTGVDAQQEALTGRLLPGHDYVGDDDHPADEADGTDSNADGILNGAVGHGTFVAGMVTMVAPDAQVLPMRVLDGDGNGTVFTVAEALYDAMAAGVDVINMSFGTSDKVTSQVLRDALKAATRQGVIVVAAAGNDADAKPRFPASVDGVTAVAATSASNATLAEYSNTGPWVDVAAIGNDLVGPLPGNTYGTSSGTSLSAPVVSGQLALLWSVNPGSQGTKVLQALDKSCRKLAKTQVRAGVVDPVASLMYLLSH